MIIRNATNLDATSVLAVNKRAFQLYSAELPQGTQVEALSETLESILADIANNHVIVAEQDGVVVGTVRWQQLNQRLAYLYRFGVEPSLLSGGVGSELLSRAIEDCSRLGLSAIALHTNARYFKLARYYYGREFFVHSTTLDKGYIRALFVKELSQQPYDLTPAFSK